MVPAPTSSTTTTGTFPLIPNSTSITLHQHQPYTASYLSHLSTFILYTPRTQLQCIFKPIEKRAISTFHLFPHSTSPTSFTNSTCNRLIQILNHVNFRSSPSTVPLALCLLLRFRTHATRETFLYGDEMWLAVSVLLAHKFLTDSYVNMQAFAYAVGLSQRELIGASWRLLEVLEYRIWVGDEEYVAHTESLNKVWRDVFCRRARAAEPLKSVRGVGHLGEEVE
jgi:hypothetical protein